ncbi:MAG: N-6 DNA methylase [Ruminococcaceae bacterium]|nr:N-6 DNA methylase [Oscillospiraceae bacterium]
MELSKLTNSFLNLIGAEKDNLFESIGNILFSERKNDILSAYVELVGGDLLTDNLQKIFQYHYADRKEKCQDYTPKSIAKLCAAQTRTNCDTVYDLCAGSGALTIQKWVENKAKTFICEELDDRVIPILLFNLAVRNISGYVINRNALTLEIVKCYRLISGENFSDISVINNVPDIVADEVVSNPPYNIKWEAPAPLLADERFQGKPIPPSSNANFAFVLTALSRMKQDGRCAFVLPNGVLSSDVEKDMREHLINSGMIERVITLPDKMFEATSIPTCIIVFSASNKTVKFYDCRRKAVQEQRDQNGQFGGASHENRTYHKTVNILPDDVIESVCGECEDIAEFSREVNTEEIAEKEYILVPSRYIKFERREAQHRPYEDIMADINRISRERSVIKITCNETLAKSLKLDKLVSQEEKASDIDLNKTFEILGGKYESRRYITLSKNKNEFKIENQDKEILSNIINFFLLMWEQHISYLNSEENRLLAELRDAMLPDLMSGKIDVSDMNI